MNPAIDDDGDSQIIVAHPRPVSIRQSTVIVTEPNQETKSNNNNIIKTETKKEVVEENEDEEQEEQSPVLKRRRTFIESIVQRASEITDEFLTTGCPILNKILHGGIPCFGLTEIFGDPGSAKTQLCLQLALFAQLPKSLGGLEAKTIYMSTECAFPTKRIAELSSHFSTKFSIDTQNNPMDGIFIEFTRDKDSLFRCLNTRIPKLVKEVGENSKVRLIILDSIASIFRSEYEQNEFVQRTRDLRLVATTLHKLGRQLKAAIVVVNQVTASLSLEQTIPSLGLAWTNMVTTRIVLHRNMDEMKRSLEVKFAHHLPSDSIEITLSNEGISAASTPAKVVVPRIKKER